MISDYPLLFVLQSGILSSNLKSEICNLKFSMMQYYGAGMMGGAGSLGIITWIVVTVDLVLLGIWLWKQVGKK